MSVYGIADGERGSENTHRENDGKGYSVYFFRHEFPPFFFGKMRNRMNLFDAADGYGLFLYEALL